MEITIRTFDYKKAVQLLLREKTHYFIAGVTLFLMVTTPFIPLLANRQGNKVNDVRSVSVDTSVEIYTVKAGDDLWKIAEKVYGSGHNAFDIAQANKLQEPYTLIENQILIIPNVKSKSPTQGDITGTAVSTKKVSSYVVQSGDYLWMIAEKIYGDGNQMSKLIDANNIPYPYEVTEGQKLIVP